MKVDKKIHGIVFLPFDLFFMPGEDVPMEQEQLNLKEKFSFNRIT